MSFKTLNSLTQTRILFSPFSETSDIHPTTKKVGVRAHSLPVAALLKILSIFGLVSGIVSIETKQGKLHLNAGSFKKWCSRHGVDDQSTAIEKIKHIVKQARPLTSPAPTVNSSLLASNAPTSNETLLDSSAGGATTPSPLPSTAALAAARDETSLLADLHLGKDILSRWALKIDLYATESPEKVMRGLVKSSPEQVEGRVYATMVPFKLVYRYIKLGLQPHDESRSFVLEQYAVSGVEALANRKQLLQALQSGRELTLSEKDDADLLSIMIEEEYKPDSVKLTAERLLEHENFFAEVEQRKVSSLQIGYLADLLDSFDTGIRLSNRKSLEMYLSPEGLKRWKEAIDSGEAFKPFDPLEQSRSFMSDDQRTRLTAILAKRDAQPRA